MNQFLECRLRRGGSCNARLESLAEVELADGSHAIRFREAWIR